MTEECQHEWACPGPVPLPQERGLAIIWPLFCTKCTELRTKVAPAPEEQTPQNKIAQARIVPGALTEFQRR
jgi:hypothetical protein